MVILAVFWQFYENLQGITALFIIPLDRAHKITYTSKKKSKIKPGQSCDNRGRKVILQYFSIWISPSVEGRPCTERVGSPCIIYFWIAHHSSFSMVGQFPKNKKKQKYFPSINKKSKNNFDHFWPFFWQFV